MATQPGITCCVHSRCVRSRCGKTDLAFRYGGDEFTIILPQTQMLQAQQVVQKLRQAFASVDFSSAMPTCKAADAQYGVAEAAKPQYLITKACSQRPIKPFITPKPARGTHQALRAAAGRVKPRHILIAAICLKGIAMVGRCFQKIGQCFGVIIERFGANRRSNFAAGVISIPNLIIRVSHVTRLLALDSMATLNIWSSSGCWPGEGVWHFLKHFYSERARQR